MKHALERDHMENKRRHNKRGVPKNVSLVGLYYLIQARGRVQKKERGKSFS